MATSKAKHLIDLTQLTPRRTKTGLTGDPELQRHRVTPKPNGKTGTGDKSATAGLMPVKAHIYHSIAELNKGECGRLAILRVVSSVFRESTRSLRPTRTLICPFTPKSDANGALKARARLTGVRDDELI